MRKRTSQSADATSKEVYRAIFVKRVHQLLLLGYGRMKPKKWANSSEEDISGELAMHIDETLDEQASAWMRFFSIDPERHVDEPHVPKAKRRLGKRRRRMDIRFRCRQRKPVLRFVYEAKLLFGSGDWQDLLGENGLERFLDGRYSRDDAHAGLLGYVQGRTEVEHASFMERALTTNTTKHRVSSKGAWRAEPALTPCTFSTVHTRRRLPDIRVYHTFLRFC